MPMYEEENDEALSSKIIPSSFSKRIRDVHNRDGVIIIFSSWDWINIRA